MRRQIGRARGPPLDHRLFAACLPRIDLRPGAPLWTQVAASPRPPLSFCRAASRKPRSHATEPAAHFSWKRLSARAPGPNARIANLPDSGKCSPIETHTGQTRPMILCRTRPTLAGCWPAGVSKLRHNNLFGQSASLVLLLPLGKPAVLVCVSDRLGESEVLPGCKRCAPASSMIQLPTGKCVSRYILVTRRTSSASRLFHSCLSWATSCQGVSVASTVLCVGWCHRLFPRARCPRPNLCGPSALLELCTALIVRRHRGA